jgi:hypothetical protein
MAKMRMPSPGIEGAHNSNLARLQVKRAVSLIQVARFDWYMGEKQPNSCSMRARRSKTSLGMKIARVLEHSYVFIIMMVQHSQKFMKSISIASSCITHQQYNIDFI